MFDGIAHRYDLLNRILSSGIDILWRKKAIRLLRASSPKVILDVATGTADLALEAMRLNPDKIIGIDISPNMLAVGRSKIASKGLSNKIELHEGSAESIGFEDATFDAVTVAFGVRNFEHLDIGLKEMCRVLKPGGSAAILEFSKPRSFPIAQLYRFYSKHLMPLIGSIISNDRSAYEYLPSTVAEFPDGSDFMKILHQSGFSSCQEYRLSFGIATIYLAQKEKK